MSKTLRNMIFIAVFAVLVLGMATTGLATGEEVEPPAIVEDIEENIGGFDITYNAANGATLGSADYTLSGNVLTLKSNKVLGISGGDGTVKLVIEAETALPIVEGDANVIEATGSIEINGGTINSAEIGENNIVNGKLDMKTYNLTTHEPIDGTGRLSGSSSAKFTTTHFTPEDVEEAKFDYRNEVILLSLDNFTFKDITYLDQEFVLNRQGYEVDTLSGKKVVGDYTVVFEKDGETISLPYSIVPVKVEGTATLTYKDGGGNLDIPGVLNAGDTVTVEAKTTLASDEEPQYIWHVGGQVYDNTDVIRSNTFELGENHTSGEVYCRVVYTENLKDELTSNKMKINIQALEGDTLITGSTNLNSTLTLAKPENENVAINADYTVQWFRDGKEITGATAQTYKIVREDLGTDIYAITTAKAETSYTGSIKSNEMEIPATAPEKPTFSIDEGDKEFEIRWSAPFANGSTIQGYIVHVKEGSSYVSGYPKEFSSLASSHTSSTLENGTKYSVYLEVESNEGNAVSSTVTITPEESNEFETSSGIEVEIDDDYVRTQIEADTSTSGSSTKAEVDEDLIEEALEITEDESGSGDDQIVEILIESSSSATKVILDLTDKAIEMLEESEVTELILITKFGTITFDKESIDSIFEDSDGEDLEISIAEEDFDDLDEEMQDAIDEDFMIYEIEIESDGNMIDDFGKGELTIVIKYELQKDEDEDDIKVFYLEEDGKLTDMDGRYDEDDEEMTFTTDHLSYYVVGFDDLDVVEESDFDLSNTYIDVTTKDWFYSAVQFVTENEMMTGTGSFKFAPSDTTTRAMIVTILWRMEGEPSALNYGFHDVASGAWYQDAVNWAALNGIVNGYSSTSFGPNDAITREQMAVILRNYTEYLDENISDSGSLSSFDDKNQISSYALESMEWAYELEFITGQTSRLIAPRSHASRAEVATILMRYCAEYDLVEDK